METISIVKSGNDYMITVTKPKWFFFSNEVRKFNEHSRLDMCRLVTLLIERQTIVKVQYHENS